MKVLIISDITLESMSKRQLLHSKNEYSFLFSEDLVSELRIVDVSSTVDIVIVYFDAFFKKYHENYIDLLLETVFSLSKRITKTVFCSNLFYSGWITCALTESAGLVGDAFTRRLSLFEGLKSASNFCFFNAQQVIYDLGKSQTYNYKMGHLYQAPYTKAYLDELAQYLDSLIIKFGSPDKKVIVLDCDNTLWNGIIGEDGIEGIACDLNYEGIVYFHFQQFLLTRKDMGFILCLCSKNNEDDVREAFLSKRMPLKWDDFVVKKVNWENKDNNIKEIAEELNLGLDSFIFIDDSDFEILRVNESLPEVSVFKMTGDYSGFLNFSSELVFERKFITEEDKTKSDQYFHELRRKNLERDSTSLDEYIKSLGIKIVIDQNPINDLTRVSQLTEKTNQFNFNKVFYSVEDLKQRITTGNLKCYTLRVSDKFGDYGLVGVILIGVFEEKLVLENYILSCRILGRRIEFDFLEKVNSSLFELYAKKISEIRFKETGKNIPAQNFYKLINSFP